MRKVTVSRMREGYAQTVLTFRITYVDGSRTGLFRDETKIDCVHFVSAMRSHNLLSRSNEQSCMFAGSTVLKYDQVGYAAV